MTHKKSGVILITALLAMTLLITGCEQSYAPVADAVSQATPTLEGDFPANLPAESMGDIQMFGQQTATALAAGTGGPSAAAEGSATETPAPAAAGDATETPASQVGLTPSGDGTVQPDVSPTSDTTISTIVPTNTPVVVQNPTTPPGSVPATYTLQEGEFPYCIARRYNLNPDTLLSVNGLSSNQGDIYQPGLTLTIPQNGGVFPGNRALRSHPVSAYVVPQADTVYGIACYFGDVMPQAIISLNSLSAPYTVTAGTALQIP
ncbi:MAG: LysM peptidoglycan-binding domain-containing protein [Anaerolineales bacterium]|nr:LysM peptidoglycan-binding domain-containing protein [Anaerolineales bacterium]